MFVVKRDIVCVYMLSKVKHKETFHLLPQEMSALKTTKATLQKFRVFLKVFM